MTTQDYENAHIQTEQGYIYAYHDGIKLPCQPGVLLPTHNLEQDSLAVMGP